jgi:hypothetical protein
VYLEEERFKKVTTDRVAEFSANLADLMRRGGKKWYCFIGYDETGFHGSDLFGKSTPKTALGAVWLPLLHRSAVAVRDHWTALCGVASIPAPPLPLALILPSTVESAERQLREASRVLGHSAEAATRHRVYVSESGSSNGECAVIVLTPRRGHF